MDQSLVLGFPFDWLVQLAVSVVLLWGTGGLVFRALAPRTYRRDALLVAPFLGFGVLTGITGYLGGLGWPVDRYAWIVLLAAALGLVASFPRLARGLRCHWPVIAICFAAYLVAMWPLISLGYLTTVGVTVDGISYAVRSEYLQATGLVRPVVPPGHPFYGWVAAQIDLLRVGDVYFVALAGSLSQARSFQLLTTTAGLFFALTPASVYVLSRRTLNVHRPTALLAASLVGIHNLLLWSVYDNFLSQTIAVSLLPVVLCFEIQTIRSLRWRETLGFTFLLAALISVYPIYALSVAALGAVFGSISLIGRLSHHLGNWREISRLYLTRAAAIVAIVPLWNVTAIWRARSELSFIGTLLEPEATKWVGPGNISVFPPPFEIAGLAAHANLAYALGGWQPPEKALWIGFLLWAAVAGFGWLHLKPEARIRAMVVVLVVLALALQQRFLVDPPHGYPYGYFKIVSLLAIVLIPLFAQGVTGLATRRYLRYPALAVLAGTVALNIVSTQWTVRNALETRVAMGKSIQQVADGVGGLPAGEWLLLDLQPGIRQNWLAYLLKDRPIHSREPLAVWSWTITDTGSPTRIYRYALVENSVNPPATAVTAFDAALYNPGQYDVIWRNEVYELRQRRFDFSPTFCPSHFVWLPLVVR
jgi:hypothetical protein